MGCVLRICESGKHFIGKEKAPPTEFYLDCEFDAFDNQSDNGWETQLIGLCAGCLHPDEIHLLLHDEVFPKLRKQGFHVQGHIQRNYDSDGECESESSSELLQKRRRKTKPGKPKLDLRWRARIRLCWIQKRVKTNIGYGHGFEDANHRGEVQWIS